MKLTVEPTQSGREADVMRSQRSVDPLFGPDVEPMWRPLGEDVELAFGEEPTCS